MRGKRSYKSGIVCHVKVEFLPRMLVSSPERWNQCAAERVIVFFNGGAPGFWQSSSYPPLSLTYQYLTSEKWSTR